MIADTRLAVRASAGQEPGQRPWKRATLWLLFLGPFFFLTYGLTNLWTARLPNVKAVWFSWERHIPFLDWTIVPYMSIDAFYALSLFLCATRAELDTHARRLLAATVISIAGFLLFPLQFSFLRPTATGAYGSLFGLLARFDKPYNQAPSLHISLLMLLWVVYARHLRGAQRWLMHAWFFLIGISVFTTFQHHVIDGITGIIAGIVCLYLFPDPPYRWSRHTGVATAERLQRLYFIASMATFTLGALAGGWAWLLLWPGTSLLLVALAYGPAGPDIFQKHNGNVSWAARMLLFPYRASAWLSSRWFTRHNPWSAEVVPGVWIGRIPGRSNWARQDIPVVLDLTAEFHASRDTRRRRYRSVPMLDLVVPSAPQLRSAVSALDDLLLHGPVLVHCALGYSRSALVISAWLLEKRLASTPENAIALVRRVRPGIVLPESWRCRLEDYRHA